MAMLPPDPFYVLKGNQGVVNAICVRINPFYSYLYAGTLDGKIHIWDLQVNREVENFTACTGSCLAVRTLDEDKLVVQEKGGCIYIWTKCNNKWTRIKQFEVEYFGFCKFLLLNSKILVPGCNATIKCISIKTSVELGTFTSSDNLGEVMCLKIIKITDKDYVLAGYESGDLKLWDLDNFTCISSYKYSDESVMAVDFDSNSLKGVCGGPTNKLHIFMLNKDLEFSLKKEILITNPGVGTLCIRPDSKLVVVGGWDSKIRLLSWKNLITLAVLDLHSSSIHDVMFYNNSLSHKHILAAASKDCKISLWDLYN